MNNNNFINVLQNTILTNKNENFNVLYNDMSKYQKEIFNNMKNDPFFLNNYSLSDLIFDFDSKFIESILSIEIDLYLEECKKKELTTRKMVPLKTSI